MKAFGDERITAGERCLVIDLGACSGMDSTFMGTIAGMATRLTSQGDGHVLQIADSGPRNRRSLEDLGLDFLVEIDPPDAPWQSRIDAVRSSLTPPQRTAPTEVQRAEHVLEAHQVLSETNEKNARVFSNVVSLLEDELAEKQKLAESPDKR